MSPSSFAAWLTLKLCRVSAAWTRDRSERERLRSPAAAGALTDANEAGRPEPWAMADAPADYLARLMRGIVGVSLAVGSLEGRWKLSQNHPDATRRGVIEGLAASDRAQDRAVADAMARLEAGGGG